MLDIKEIKEILPHRYPMLLIDRVIEMDIEEKLYVKGYKNVSANEAFFQGHYPEEPIMPGVLQIEALAQAGKGVATVDGKVACEAEILFAIG